MMNNLIIQYYEKLSDTKPTLTVLIPLSIIDIAYAFIPKKLKAVLEKEGINIRQSKELVKEKDLKGELVEIENIGERVIFSVD